VDALLIVNEEKKKYLKNLSNESGVIAALAIDQRGSLKKMLAQAAGNPVMKLISLNSRN
jgi:tagatose 1,6-diphosphate aldolase